MSGFTLPIVDLDVFRQAPSSPAARAEAGKTASALIRYGALIVKDSRVSEEANDRFLDRMEDYFDQPQEELEKDVRPEYHYQAGATLENTEKPKCHLDAPCKAIIASLDPAERPLDLEGGKADPKCRFFHRMGVTPPETEFATLAMQNVTPSKFASTWEASMEDWGLHIKSAVEGVASMLGAGLGVGDALLEAGMYGPHLLAPTATNLAKYGRDGEIFAGFHTDLNFLTIHGRSRYPGLHIWARNTGKRISVKLPPGHLLVQAGRQLEHLTGGLILAGYHEVICNAATLAAVAARAANPATSERPSIRISSTFFWHLSSDYELQPREFAERMQLLPEAKVAAEEESGQRSEYIDMKVGTLVQEELKHIALME